MCLFISGVNQFMSLASNSSILAFWVKSFLCEESFLYFQWAGKNWKLTLNVHVIMRVLYIHNFQHVQASSSKIIVIFASLRFKDEEKSTMKRFRVIDCMSCWHVLISSIWTHSAWAFIQVHIKYNWTSLHRRLNLRVYVCWLTNNLPSACRLPFTSHPLLQPNRSESEGNLF